MPTPLSGMRTARSLVTPVGSNDIVSRVLDFDLGAQDGIEISGVLGLVGSFGDVSTPVSDTIMHTADAVQTLHLEAGTLEGVPYLAGEDEDDIDTEIFWQQVVSRSFLIPATTAVNKAGMAMQVTPSGLVTFPEPILAARNITHRGETQLADNDCSLGVLIYYRYVRFSLQELGFLLARRQ